MIISMIEKVGFNKKWRFWIKECMASVTSKILINGSLGNEKTPSRGLRQGDPLSPFLFLLRAKGLFASLIDPKNTNRIARIKTKRSNPIIFHLLFANDCYIFSRICSNEVDQIIYCLLQFNEVLGQTINHVKLKVIFNQNTPRQFRRVINGILGIKQSLNTSSYLDFLTSIGRDKIVLFSYTEEMTRLRVKWWKGKLLSQVGKEILLKSILSAIPLYVMSCFLIPKTIVILQRPPNVNYGGVLGKMTK